MKNSAQGIVRRTRGRGTYHNFIVGGAAAPGAADILFAHPGSNNYIAGGGGNDILIGGTGTDGSPSDSIGPGNLYQTYNSPFDVLWGGLGNDTLIGGTDVAAMVLGRLSVALNARNGTAANDCEWRVVA